MTQYSIEEAVKFPWVSEVLAQNDKAAIVKCNDEGDYTHVLLYTRLDNSSRYVPFVSIQGEKQFSDEFFANTVESVVKDGGDLLSVTKTYVEWQS